MIIILLLCLCFATKNYQVDGWMPNLSKNEDLDLEKRLKVINKPPIKTIKTEFGHIVDCIDINQQLAFDNPLLKNHKIQLKPSFQDTTTKVKVHGSSGRLSKIGLGKKLCPRGTVPIRRTTKEDLIRTNWLSNNIGTLTLSNHGVHYAEMHLKYNPAIFFGISGTISAYNPSVTKGQMSSAYIWVANGTSDSDVNSIQIGWQVYPDIIGDFSTHFFAQWSNNIQHTGCIDLVCPGFVQTSQSIYVGAPLSNTSIYGGTQAEMSLALTQDEDTKNWWLSAQNTQVGYFPAALFSNKLQYANQGGWTGKTWVADSSKPSPAMGSGHFPDGNFEHGCYISKMMFKNEYRQDMGPLTSMLETYVDSPRCYDVRYYKYVDDHFQRALQFGGPGGDDCGD